VSTYCDLRSGTKVSGRCSDCRRNIRRKGCSVGAISAGLGPQDRIAGRTGDSPILLSCHCDVDDRVREVKEQEDTLALCKQIREAHGSPTVPILLVIGQYQLPHGNAVLGMGNARFIITPFDGEILQVKIDSLLGIT